MSEFTKNLDEIVHIAGKKVHLTNHLQKNYRKNVHYIIKSLDKKDYKQGGHNKRIFLLTETAFELLKNSYNLRNRYIVDISDTVSSVNIGMCIENQTIGFIENSFKEVIQCKRQYLMNSYRIDLYFPDYKLAVECDEYGHIDRDPIKEKEREKYIITQGNKIIRYNPNTSDFDLSNVLKQINKIVFQK